MRRDDPDLVHSRVTLQAAAAEEDTDHVLRVEDIDLAQLHPRNRTDTKAGAGAAMKVVEDLRDVNHHSSFRLRLKSDRCMKETSQI